MHVQEAAVIGAGVSGVAAAAHLEAAGIKVTVFERSAISGGVWVFDSRLPPEPAYPSLKASMAEIAYFACPDETKKDIDIQNCSTNQPNQRLEIYHAPPGPCYEGLSNNVPTGLMEMTLNPWKPGTEQIVEHSIVADYIQDTASKTGVDEITLYNTRVERVLKERNSWQIRTSALNSKKEGKIFRDWHFDAVIVATGHYHAPKVPAILGLQQWKNAWPSRIQHSKRYRSPRDYQGKTVLLIGGSTSSVDIAKELGKTAKTIYQSTRRGLFDLPASMLPVNATRIAEVARFNKALTANLQFDDDSGPIPAVITLADGTELRGIDNIIICTGYHCSFPFLAQYHNDLVPAEKADEQTLVTDGLQMHNLHKDIFYISDPTLAFIGVPYHVATFSLFDYQAIVVAAVYSDKSLLPSPAEMRIEYNEKIRQKGIGRSFHSLKGQDVTYVNELLSWINPGIIARGGKRIRGHSEAWKAQYEELLGKVEDQSLGQEAARV